MSKFYAVAHGYKRGVFLEWAEAKKQIDKFPQPVYKKFSTEQDAQKYLDDRKAKKVELSFPEPSHETYYAVARGHTVGVFTDYNAVKEHIKNYPQPMQKKFSTLDEAIAYFHKYYDGKMEEKKEEKKETKRKAKDEEKEVVEKKKKK